VIERQDGYSAIPFRCRRRSSCKHKWSLNKLTIHRATPDTLVILRNHAALRLVASTMSGDVTCVYIDPPYNSGAHRTIASARFLVDSTVAVGRDMCGLQDWIGSRGAVLRRHSSSASLNQHSNSERKYRAHRKRTLLCNVNFDCTRRVVPPMNRYRSPLSQLKAV